MNAIRFLVILVCTIIALSLLTKLYNQRQQHETGGKSSRRNRFTANSRRVSRQSHGLDLEYSTIVYNEHDHGGGGGGSHDIHSEDYCYNMTDVNIYTLGSKLNCRDNSESFSMSVVLALGITIAIELLAHHLEHKFKHNVLHLTMLNKIYKELMLLGLIGFSINVMETMGMFEEIFKWSQEISHALGLHTAEDSHETEHERIERRVLIFDFVHVSLFFLSVFYVIIVAICYRLVRRTWRRWKLYEDGGQKKAEDYHRHITTRIKSSRAVLLLFNWRLMYNYAAALDRLNYFSVRKRFILVNNLQGRTFRFDHYLKECALRLFVHTIEIDSKIWAICLLIFGVNYLRNKLFDFTTIYSGVPMFVGLIAGGSMFISLVVFISLRFGYSKYTKRYRIDTSSLQRDDLSMHTVIDDDNEEQVLISHQGYGSVNYPSHHYQSTAPIEHLPVHHDPDVLSGFSDDNDNAVIPIHRYFLFRLPHLSFIAFQLSLLIQSFYLSLYVIHFVYVIIIENAFSIASVGVRYALALQFLVPSIICVLVMFPLILPLLCILSNIEDRTKQKEVSTLLRKQKLKRIEAEEHEHH